MRGSRSGQTITLKGSVPQERGNREKPAVKYFIFPILYQFTKATAHKRSFLLLEES